jgi:hypothetical protein
MEEAEAHSMRSLPDELLLRVLEHATVGWDGRGWWHGAFHGVYLLVRSLAEILKRATLRRP